MKKKTEIPTNNPQVNQNQGDQPEQGQRNNTPDREDIAANRPAEYNSNSGPQQRSQNKKS
jgi:hypothetical protein